jgi:tetratricopeptide (TPR) repeat protein
MSRQIDDIVETLKAAKERKVSAVLLVGAGCSVTAGVPTANQFVKLIAERYPRSYERAKQKQYPQCMAELSVAERRHLVSEYIDQAIINWAHIGIAQLMLHRFIDRVLTTNFDPLIMQACSLVDIFPAVYDFAASQFYKPADIPNRAVFHLHGQHTGFVLLHTQEECERHSTHLAPVFEDAGRARVWIVIGYSGENDPVFEHLARIDRFDNRLYWIGYKDQEPLAHVRERLLHGGKDAHYVSGFDADDFFVTLAQKLDCFPPTFITRPFSHLAERFDRLATFRSATERQPSNVVSITRQVIQQAVKLFEPPQPGADDADRNVLAAQDAPAFFTAMGHLIAGQYDEVLALRPKKGQPIPNALRQILAQAHISKGGALLSDAQSGPNIDQRERKLSEAIEHYKKALEVQEHCWPASYGWGRALALRAMGRIGRRGGEDLENALSKFEDALKHKGDIPTVTQEIVNALVSFATRGHDEPNSLLNRANLYLREALTAHPNHPNLRTLRALLLMECGRHKDGTEGDADLQLAYDEYLALADSGPVMSALQHNAGNALGYLAMRKTGEAADRLYEQALRHFQQATLVPAQFVIRLNAMGWVNQIWGQNSQFEQRELRLERAAQLYESALDAAPEFALALGNLLAVQRLRAPLLVAEQSAALFLGMLRRVDAAEAKQADAILVTLLRADTMVELSRWLPDADGVALREQALAMYQLVAEKDRERPLVAAAVGNLLLKRAGGLTGDCQCDTFAEAVRWFAREHKLAPKKSSVAYSYAQALHTLAKCKVSKEREKLIHQAVELLRPFAQPGSPVGLLTLQASMLCECADFRSKKSGINLLIEAEKLLDAAHSSEPRSHRILVEWALNLAMQAQHASGADGRTLGDRSVEKVRLAIEIRPNDPDLHAFLGNALLWRENAGRDEGSEARLRNAIYHFGQASQTSSFVLQGWAQALIKLADLEPVGPDTARLLKEATEHTKRAEELEPNVANHAVNCGFLLRRRAALLANDAGPPLLIEAEQSYARAQAISSQLVVAILGRAASLAELSLLQDGALATQTWQRAKQLFEGVQRAHPDEPDVHISYGNALLGRAEAVPSEKSWELAERAFRCAVECAQQRGQKLASPHVGIAAALEQRAARASGSEEGVQLAFNAMEELLLAEELQPRTADAASVFCRIALRLIRHVDDAQQTTILEAARARCANVESSAASASRLPTIWGLVLTELAARSDPETSANLFQEALDKLEQGGHASSDTLSSLFNQAACWLSWARCGSRHEAMARIERADLLMTRAASIATSPMASCGLIEVRIMRALFAETGTDEALLAAALADLTQLLESEAQTAGVFYMAGRIRLICGSLLSEPRASEQRALSREHFARSEQLEPGILRAQFRVLDKRRGQSMSFASPEPLFVAPPEIVIPTSGEATPSPLEGTTLESGSTKV